MSASRLSLGISEDRNYVWPKIERSAFDENGPYESAIVSLHRMLAKPSSEKIHQNYWDRCLGSGSTLPAKNYEKARLKHRYDIGWIMIYEAENARIWHEGPPDHMSMLREYHNCANSDVVRLKNLISGLRTIGRRHAYLLRNCLNRAMQGFLSDDELRRARIPNANARNGYEVRTISGPTVRYSEFQYASKLSLFHFDDLLNSLEREIDESFRPWPRAWMEFGALRFSRGLDPRTAARMNITQLGLLARLSSRMRDFTNGYGIRAYGTGQPLPSHGRPCWDIVAEFVNCALNLDNPLTGETAQRVWNKFAKKHKPSMQSWPNPAKQEPQVQKN